MPITRNSNQARRTLEQFYQDAARNGYGPPGAGAQMLRLLEEINGLFPQTQLWGLTSLDRLVVQSTDDYASPWYIVVSVETPGCFHFRYLLPPTPQPRRRHSAEGEATTQAQARRYLLIAMRDCGGWAGSAELAARLAEHGLAR